MHSSRLRRRSVSGRIRFHQGVRADVEQQRVAGEQDTAGSMEQTDMAGRMPGKMEDLELGSVERQPFAAPKQLQIADPGAKIAQSPLALAHLHQLFHRHALLQEQPAGGHEHGVPPQLGRVQFPDEDLRTGDFSDKWGQTVVVGVSVRDDHAGDLLEVQPCSAHSRRA
jgi:hypothetical protein